MKTFKWLLAAFIFSWLSFANAATTDQKQYSIYFNNSTPVPIILGVSNLNKTPLHFSTTEIPAHIQGLYVGAGDIIDTDEKVNVTFYAYVQTGPRSFANTPLIHITQKGYTVGMDCQPYTVTVEGKKYSVYAYTRVSGDISAIVVDISPL